MPNTATKKVAKKRRPMTAENRAKLAANLVKARAARAAKARTGPAKQAKKAAAKKTTAKRRVVKKTAGSRGPGRPPKITDAQLHAEHERVVARYLRSLTNGHAADGGELPRFATLTGVPGMSGRSSDPDKIEQAADAIDGQIDETDDPIRKLKLIKKSRDWKRLAERLRTPADFIAIGGEWCTTNGYTREMMELVGVPRAVLKEAGIE